MKNILPNKPSELAELALHDLTLCERSKKYDVDMDYWHEPIETEVGKFCAVCFAGSMMAKTFHTPTSIPLCPDELDITEVDMNKLRALDDLRRGDVIGYLRGGFFMDLNDHFSYEEINHIVYELDVEPYEWCKTTFKRNVRKIIRWLKKRGY